MVARLNDLPAAPAFEDAASALAPGGVSWPPYGVQKLPIVSGHAGARSFRVVRADWRGACGNCGNRRRPRRSTPDSVPGPLCGTQELPVDGGASMPSCFVFSALISGCLRELRKSEQAAPLNTRRRSRASIRSARIRGRRRARRRHLVFVFSALIGETLAVIAEIRAVRRLPQTVVGSGR